MRRAARDQPVPHWIGRRPLESVTELMVDGADGPRPARLYRPHGARGLVLYLHGGGFTVCSLDSHDGVCCRLARSSRASVLSLDYRLAPEHPYPAAIEDCHAAYRWLLANADRYGGGNPAIAVAGDSAGGNLATVTAMMARDRGDKLPCLQLLFYPPTMGRRKVPSHDRFGRGGYLLTNELIAWFRFQYIGLSRTEAPYLAPALSDDLAGMPPALIVTAAFDPLRDEGHEYAERLAAAGCSVRYRCIDGTVHGFVNMYPVLPSARRVLRDTGRAIRTALDLASLGLSLS